MLLNNIDQKTVIDFKLIKIVYQKKVIANIWSIAQITWMEIFNRLTNFDQSPDFPTF